MQPTIKTFIGFLGLLVYPLLLAPTAASAQSENAPHHYALVVGANTGGPGQERLQFAERDAANIASVLESLGNYPNKNITRLSQPTPSSLRVAIKRIAGQLKTQRDAGNQTSLVFYYSGHARANALNLGDAELPLATLRAELEALPSTLTVVILDACQSGSFSRIKGVRGAADFSVNSVANLNATGMAVMASSSASELSQESERLGSSYFTHYLTVALRGAGDDNRDGRVTLDEAYRYAYNRTLAATAKTAVGKQHVTLETDLRGKGEIALTYPSAMQSALILSKTTEGEFLVQAAKSGSVMAEVSKVADREVRLALAPGDYKLIVRIGETAQECRQRVRPSSEVTFDASDCTRIELEDTTSKGYHVTRPWSVELGMGWANGRDDAFVGRLRDFGFEGSASESAIHIDFSAYRHVSRHVWAGLSVVSLNEAEFIRDGDTEQQRYDWSTTAFLAALRYEHAVLESASEESSLIPYIEVAGGLSRATTLLVAGREDEKVDYGFAVSAAAGVQLMIVPGFGLFAKGRYAVAPTVDNLLGETHDSGGTYVSFGVRGTIVGR